MKYKDKQKKYKPEIIRILKKNPQGMIATEIKEQLNNTITRNTIQSYLDQLKIEKKVQSIKIGRYELWFFKEVPKAGQKTANNTIYSFLSTFLNELEKSPANEVMDWKQFGLTIGKTFGFEPIFPPNLEKYVVDDIIESYKLSSEMYPSILKEIFSYFGDEEIEIEPPIIQEKIYNIIYRIRGSKFSKNKIFFQVLCGIEEAEISKFIRFPIKVNVIQHIPEKKLVDISVTLFPTKKV